MPFAEHDERYDNPPAPPRKAETSPRMISRLGVFTSYQVNVDSNGQNIVGDAANECVISVEPDRWQQNDHRLEAVQRCYLELSGRVAGVILQTLA